ncbi:MAG: hypothetical protein WCT53_00255 [Candidatus Gracilibacteria bacterium]
MKSIKKNTSAGILLEAILAIGIIAMVFTGIIGVSLGGLTGTLRGEERLPAVALAQESLEAVRSIRDFSWENLTAGIHGLSDTSNYWALTDTPDAVGIYTRQVTVADVDAATKDVVVSIGWEVLPGVNNEIEITNRFTNWLNKSWIQTLLADLDVGTKSSTKITNTAGGEITLANQADFSESSVFATHNFPGDGDITDIVVVGNTLYLVTTNDAGGKEFASVDISNIASGTITDLNALELGTQANRLAISNGYAYIATNSNSEEVIIVRLSDFTKVNSINIPGDENATGIAILGTSLCVTKERSWSKEFYAYDVSNPESPIGAALGSVELDTDGNEIVMSGNYAYVATDKNSKELMVVKLSTYTVVNSVDLHGDQDANAIGIDGTSVYIGRDGSGSEDEFYSLNIASPEGSITINGSADLEGEWWHDNDVADLSVVGNTAYLGLQHDSDWRNRKIAIVNTSNNAITGWVDVDASDDLHLESIWVAGIYVYVGSSHSTRTLQVIRGDENGAYFTNGSFISSALDTGSADTIYNSISWTKAGTGIVKFQLRTADTQENLSSAVWVGPDGTSATFYETSETGIVTKPGASKRWMQYKADLSGDGLTTPIINDVSVTYEN